jgi:hypothetical protein
MREARVVLIVGLALMAATPAAAEKADTNVAEKTATKARTEHTATEEGDEPRRLDPNYSRLMFSPTGRPLRKGDGYFSDYELLFPGASYGVTDHFTLSGGVSAIPGLGLGEQLFYVSPKIGLEVGQRQAYSIGFLYATAKDDERYSAGIGYAVGTWGTRKASLTAGFGVAGDLDDGLHTPILMVGGHATLSNSVALVGESWILLQDVEARDQPVGLAVRFFGNRLSADVGVVLSRTILEEGFPVPWVSVSYHFGPGRAAAAMAPPPPPLQRVRPMAR